VSRAISATTRAALYAQQTSAALPILIEITHGVVGYDNPLRLVNNSVDLVYGGNTYLAFPFKFDPPDQKDDGTIANAKLSICAVDQQIAAILRSTAIAPTVRAVATFWSDESGSVVFEEIASWDFTLRNVSGSVDVISAELIYEDRLDNAVPSGEFNSHFPGII
jgi:hypothetical protein